MHTRAVTVACVLLAATATAHAEPGFDEALHAQLRGKKGNLFYSPASVRIALAMAMFGARGATQSELAKALALPAGAETARAIGAQLDDWEKSTPGVVLQVRDRVWAQSGRALVADYVATLRDVLHAPLASVDFAHDRDGARRTINQWVADVTQGKIPALIGGELDAPTRMVLINTIYFKGKWSSPFWPDDTTDETFFADGTRQVKVRMMHHAGEGQAARVDDGLILERPYGRDGRLVMDIILPNARKGIGAIEDAYVRGMLSSWLEKLQPRQVDVSLPRFKLSSALWLQPALRGLGIVRAGKSGDADFSGIDGTRELYISQVVHEAAVDVDESGTEATAATAVMPTAPAMAMPPPEERIVFRADHPFLFVIRDARANVVLFAGRVVDPTAK